MLINSLICKNIKYSIARLCDLQKYLHLLFFFPTKYKNHYFVKTVQLS